MRSSKVTGLFAISSRCCRDELKIDIWKWKDLVEIKCCMSMFRFPTLFDYCWQILWEIGKMMIIVFTKTLLIHNNIIQGNLITFAISVVYVKLGAICLCHSFVGSVAFWSSLPMISTDYWTWTFNIYTEPLFDLPTLLSVCLFVVPPSVYVCVRENIHTHTHTGKYSPLTHDCCTTTAHWLTASVPKMTCRVPLRFSGSQQYRG